MKPDPHTELAAIRADIAHLATIAATTTDDLATLKALQKYLAGWIHKHTEKENDR